LIIKTLLSRPKDFQPGMIIYLDYFVLRITYKLYVNRAIKLSPTMKDKNGKESNGCKKSDQDEKR